MTLAGDLIESKGQLAESRVQLRDAYQDRIATLKDLLSTHWGIMKQNRRKPGLRLHQQQGINVDLSNALLAWCTTLHETQEF